MQNRDKVSVVIPPQSQNSLAGKERHPGKAQVMRVHKHVLDKKVWTAAVLEYRGDKNEKAQINELHLEPDFTPRAYPSGTQDT